MRKLSNNAASLRSRTACWVGVSAVPWPVPEASPKACSGLLFPPALSLLLALLTVFVFALVSPTAAAAAPPVLVLRRSRSAAMTSVRELPTAAAAVSAADALGGVPLCSAEAGGSDPGAWGAAAFAVVLGGDAVVAAGGVGQEDKKG